MISSNKILYETIKCCLNENEHIVDKSVVLLNCGGNACRPCIIDSVQEDIYCYRCNKKHKKNDIIHSPSNESALLLINLCSNEIINVINEKIKTTCESFYGEEILNEMETKIKRIETEIDEKCEELIKDIRNNCETFKIQFNRNKDNFKKLVQNKHQLENEMNENLNKHDQIIMRQNQLFIYQKQLSSYRKLIEEIKFIPKTCTFNDECIFGTILNEIPINSNKLQLDELDLVNKHVSQSILSDRNRIVDASLNSESCVDLNYSSNAVLATNDNGTGSKELMTEMTKSSYSEFNNDKENLLISSATNSISFQLDNESAKEKITEMMDTTDFTQIFEPSTSNTIYDNNSALNYATEATVQVDNGLTKEKDPDLVSNYFTTCENHDNNRTSLNCEIHSTSNGQQKSLGNSVAKEKILEAMRVDSFLTDDESDEVTLKPIKESPSTINTCLIKKENLNNFSDDSNTEDKFQEKINELLDIDGFLKKILNPKEKINSDSKIRKKKSFNKSSRKTPSPTSSEIEFTFNLASEESLLEEENALVNDDACFFTSIATDDQSNKEMANDCSPSDSEPFTDSIVFLEENKTVKNKKDKKKKKKKKLDKNSSKKYSPILSPLRLNLINSPRTSQNQNIIFDENIDDDPLNDISMNSIPENECNTLHELPLDDDSIKENDSNQHITDSVTEISDKKKRKRKKKELKSKEYMDEYEEVGDEEIESAKHKSGTNNEATSDEENNEINEKRKRRKTRKIMEDSKLKPETLLALEQEADRVKRLESQKQLAPNIIDDKYCDLYLDNAKIIKINRSIGYCLKDYQIKGIQFMFENCYESVQATMNDYQGGGCILAHCMGLGKTLQIITLLHTVLTYTDLTKTKHVLVLTPMNVLLNWCQEFEKWLKDCFTFRIYEITSFKTLKDRLALLKSWHEHGGVFILSYDMFKNFSNEKISSESSIRDEIEKYLINPGPDLIVCDEGHVLKNAKTVLSKSINCVKTLRRIVLTGSPLQNNLDEYHCMISFIKPNIFGTIDEFRNRFVNPINNGQLYDSTQADVQDMKKRAHVLHKTLSGFVQRMNHNVIKPLIPIKLEYVISIRLSEIQQKLYKIYVESYRESKIFVDFRNLYRIWTHPWLLKVKSNKNNINKKESDDFDEIFQDEDSTSAMNCGISELEQLNHSPNNINRESIEDTSNQTWWNELVVDQMEYNSLLSGKIVLFAEILKSCQKVGDKLIIFSQFLFTLDLIENFLKYWKDTEKCSFMSSINYYRIDGSTDGLKRSKYVNEFNDSECPVNLFLISTKAGGIGINLIGANRVILFDASWNPAHDLQAIFRVYRLGQKKPVFIYRFIAQGTMEEKIYNRQVHKQSLSLRVIDEHQLDRHFKSNELTELYEHKPDSKEETELKDYIPPDDNLLADILKSSNKWISKYHEHDSLLVNRLDEGLSELDRINAWQEYENEKQKPKLSMDKMKPESTNNERLSEISSRSSSDSNQVLEKKFTEKYKSRAHEDFIIACENGRVEKVEELLKKKLSVNLKSSNGFTALHQAIKNKQSVIVKLLLDNKANPNETTSLGYTALHFACQVDHIDIVDLLLKHNALINVRTVDDLTPLYIASQNGCHEIVQRLLNNNAEFYSKKKDNWNALHIAADKGRKEVVSILLESKVDLNAQTTTGFTALHLASYGGHVNVVELLLKYNAHLNIKTNDGWTALYKASENGHKDIVSMLLEHKADVNEKAVSNWTALHIASEKGKTEVVDILLKYKADIHVKTNEKHYEAIHLATINGHREIVALLISHKADVNLKSEYGWTPLHFACSKGHKDLVKLLLKSNANINAKKDNGWTPLHIASLNGHKDIADLLIEKHADIYLATNDNETALDIAIRSNKTEFVNFIIQQYIPK